MKLISNNEISLTHFLFLLDKLTYERRIQTVILSATLPKLLIDHLCDNEGRNFPRIANEGDFFDLIQEKPGEVKRGTVIYRGHCNTLENLIQSALEAYRQGQQVILVVNRVYKLKSEKSDDQPSLEAIWSHLRTIVPEIALLVYHGHQFPAQRRLSLDRLRELNESRKTKKEPYILLTTSAFEVGVDVSCDVMYTEICDPDAFIQRIGRCARKENEIGGLYTFGKPSGQANTEERQAQEKLCMILEEKVGQPLDAPVKDEINVLNLFDDMLLCHRRSTIIYISDSALYDYVYNFVATGVEFWRKGVLVTRTWEPTYLVQRDGADRTERLRIPVHYSIPTEYIKAWWFEVRDEDTRLIQISGKVDDTLKKMRETGVEVINSSNEKAVNGYQATLVILLKPGGYDDVFGLKERIDVKIESKPAGMSLLRKTVKILGAKAPGLFWFEPSKESEGN